jgi:hypothetical protein
VEELEADRLGILGKEEDEGGVVLAGAGFLSTALAVTVTVVNDCRWGIRSVDFAELLGVTFFLGSDVLLLAVEELLVVRVGVRGAPVLFATTATSRSDFPDPLWFSGR